MPGATVGICARKPMRLELYSSRGFTHKSSEGIQLGRDDIFGDTGGSECLWHVEACTSRGQVQVGLRGSRGLPTVLPLRASLWCGPQPVRSVDLVTLLPMSRIWEKTDGVTSGIKL